MTDSVIGGGDFELEQPGNSGEYDPVTERYYHLTATGIWVFDFGAVSWQQLLPQGPPGIHRSSVLDSKRRVIWSYGGSFGGGSTLSAYFIDTNVFSVVATTSPPGNRDMSALAYDAANDQLVLWGGSADPTDNSVWNYDLATGAWTEYAAPGGPPSSPVLGRFLYEPLHDLFLLVESVDSVWVWKNTLAGPAIFADGFESGDVSAWFSAAPWVP